MKKVKDILENYSVRNCKTQIDSDRMSLLCEAGLFDENTLRMAKRAYEKSPSNMTMAEKTAILEVTDALLTALIVEKKDHLAAFDKKASKAVSEKDMPTIIILKRKAIRVFPDNQKIGLYYSQALDKYVSIPFGPEDKHSGTHLNEALGYKTPDRKTRRGRTINTYRNNVPMFYGREGNYDSEMIKAAKTPMLRTKKRTPEQISAFRRIVRAEVVKGNIAGALGLQLAHWATSAINAVRRNFGRKTPKLSRRVPAPAETHSDANTQPEPPPTIPGLDGKPKTKIGGSRQMANRPVPAVRMKESFFNNLNLIREQVLKQPPTFSGPEGPGGPNKPDPGPLAPLGVVGGAVGRLGVSAVGAVANRVLGRTAASRAPNVLSTGATPAAEAAKRIATRQEAIKRLNNMNRARASRGAGPGVGTGAALGLGAKGALDTVTGGGGPGENLFTSTGGHTGTFTPGGSAVSDQITGRKTPVALVPRSYGGGINALGGPIGFNESVISQAKALISEGTDEKVITIKESTINLHKSVAKKLIKVYESLNNTNRKKFEKMLNEDVTSFKKALQFALRN